MFFALLAAVKSWGDVSMGYVPGNSVKTITVGARGLLVMAHWPKATLTITVKGQTTKLTSSDGYTMFTFKDDATVKIDNSDSDDATYSIHGMAEHSAANQGVVTIATNRYYTYISSYDKTLSSGTKYDILLCAYGNYYLTGTIKHDGYVNDGTFFYYPSGVGSESSLTLTGKTTFSSSISIHYPSQIGNCKLGTLKFTSSDLAITSTSSPSATIPLVGVFKCDYYVAGSSNWLYNMAFGDGTQRPLTYNSNDEEANEHTVYPVNVMNSNIPDTKQATSTQPRKIKQRVYRSNRPIVHQN